MKSITIAALGIVCVTGPLLAQGRGTPPAPTTGRGAAAQKPRAAATSAARVMVRDPSGAPLPGVKVTLSGGDASAEEITNGFGAAVFSSLKDGTYRLRFDSTGFVPFEREFTVHAPQPITIETQLSAAPPPPAPPPPPKPAAPALGPAGPPVTLSIPNYLDKNLISGRDPLKESVLACNSLETVRVLQLREALAEHTHADADEVLYVVAGEGAIRMGTDVTPMSAGSVSVVPHGLRHAVERRGKNPLILLSTLSGAPCKATQ